MEPSWVMSKEDRKAMRIRKKQSIKKLKNDLNLTRGCSLSLKQGGEEPFPLIKIEVDKATEEGHDEGSDEDDDDPLLFSNVLINEIKREKVSHLNDIFKWAFHTATNQQFQLEPLRWFPSHRFLTEICEAFRRFFDVITTCLNIRRNTKTTESKGPIVRSALIHIASLGSKERLVSKRDFETKWSRFTTDYSVLLSDRVVAMNLILLSFFDANVHGQDHLSVVFYQRSRCSEDLNAYMMSKYGQKSFESMSIFGRILNDIDVLADVLLLWRSRNLQDSFEHDHDYCLRQQLQ